jgi:hypothetical protein
MNFIKRMLKRARESEIMSREKANYESAALTSIKAMVSIWADDYHRGEPLKGHHKVRWMKSVYARIQELDELFKEDEKLYKELKEVKK